MVNDPDPDAGPRAGYVKGWASRVRHSLQIWVAFLLSLALLPIGIVAVGLSLRLLEATEDMIAASLKAQTAALAEPEREAIFTTIGSARVLADTVPLLVDGSAQCALAMRRFVEGRNDIAFAGYVDRTGRTRCNNFNQEIDLSDSRATREILKSQSPDIRFVARGRASGEAVIAVSEPVFGPRAEFRGFVTLSVRVSTLTSATLERPTARNAYVATYNASGQFLTSVRPPEEVVLYMPDTETLTSFLDGRQRAFITDDRSGRLRKFVVSPIVVGQAYAVGSWPAKEGLTMTGPIFGIATVLLPVLMWAVGIAVAVLAINRLVLRHIRDLGRRMRSFADTRQMAHSRQIEKAPTELRDIDRTFDQMAKQLLLDEAELENALFERGVLMKEVHHRVKNNLQLISSIINMQARETRSEEAQQMLHQFRDRVSSLAAVHRALYEEPSVSGLRIDVLLNDLVGQLLAISTSDSQSVQVTKELDPVRLFPDQAGPLSMLATEAVVNALKYGGPGEDGAFRLLLRLKIEAADDDAGDVSLIIANTLAPGAHPDEVTGTGLGARLIQAFASQLEGELHKVVEDGWFRLSVRFPARDFDLDDPAEA